MSRWADRLLEKVAPHAVAHAADCAYECSCGTWGYAKYCCYYPNGVRHCGSCIRHGC
ncbi:MAG: hypothetical protein HOY71_15830 [Nonomuraea sp.]|nr:hypothetical protein [Nonomuraea sp.]